MERQAKGIWIPIEIWESKELTWNEKILFLEIDSFTSNERDCFFSNEYIANLLGVTENSANRILSSLISKGYVIKTSFDGRRRFIKTAYSYDKAAYSQMNKQSNQESISCSNNEEYIPNTSNNTVDLEEEKDKSFSKKEVKTRKKYDEYFEQCWKEYGRKGNKAEAFKRWKKLSDEDKSKILPHIKAYIQSKSEKTYQKDFERYISNRTFDTVVYKGNMIIFDPERENDTDNEYRPQLDGFNLHWNEQVKCYISMYDIDMLFDGYTSENRPSSAMVMKGGIRYKWNTQTKKWEVQ